MQGGADVLRQLGHEGRGAPGQEPHAPGRSTRARTRGPLLKEDSVLCRLGMEFCITLQSNFSPV